MLIPPPPVGEEAKTLIQKVNGNFYVHISSQWHDVDTTQCTSCITVQANNRNNETCQTISRIQCITGTSNFNLKKKGNAISHPQQCQLPQRKQC